MVTSGENLLNVDYAATNTNFIFKIQSFKTVLPQIQAALFTTIFSLHISECVAFPGILIPDLMKPDSPFNLTISETSWINSASYLIITFGGTIAGLLVDYFGRLVTLRLSVIPFIIGWITIALAGNVTMLITARIIHGIAINMSSISVMLYISEIGWPAIRGSLFVSACITAAIGIELIYLKRLFLSWRAIAWCEVIFNIINFCLTLWTYETPIWLVRKGKINEARRSLEWFHKYQISSTNQSNAEIHLMILKQQDLIKKEKESKQKGQPIYKMLLKPEVYKPSLILTILFFIQQFSGVYVIQSNAIIFFEKIGGKIDPLISSNLISGLPIIISFINLFTMKRFNRKTLLIASCLGASICLFMSALFTKLIQDGTSSQDWIPIFFIFLYMATVIMGLETLPWSIASELMPQKLRGFLLSVIYSVSSLIMFGALFSYQYLDIIVGCVGVQIIYGSVTFFGSFFVYFVVPETHKKTLHEIENDFDQD